MSNWALLVEDESTRVECHLLRPSQQQLYVECLEETM